LNEPQVRCLQLIEEETGNFELPAFPGLIVKESFIGSDVRFWC